MRPTISVGTGFSLGPFRRDMERRLQAAAKRATDRAAAGALADIRSAMKGQRLGGLANVIRMTSDLKKGSVHARGDGGWSASGVVYAKTGGERTRGALQAYTEGAIILPRKGRWLALPTNEIPKRAGRRRMTPKLYNEKGFDQRIGPLKFVPTKRTGVAMLVVENVSINPLRNRSARRLPKSGRARAGRAHVGIVAFILIRSTRRARRITTEAIAAKWQARTPQFMSAALAG